MYVHCDYLVQYNFHIMKNIINILFASQKHHRSTNDK